MVSNRLLASQGYSKAEVDELLAMRDNKMDDLQNQINALKNQSSGSHGPVLDVSFIGDDGSKTVKFFIITYTDGTTKQIRVKSIFPA